MCNHKERSKLTEFVYYKVDGHPIEIMGDLERIMKFGITTQLGNVYYVVETRVYNICCKCGNLVDWSTDIECMSRLTARNMGFGFAGEDLYLKCSDKVAVKGGRLIK
jgi:hypothetical protein